MSLEGMESTSKREQFGGKQHRHWSISCGSLPFARALEAEPRILLALRRAKTICESSGKAPFHPNFCLARRTNCTHSAMTRRNDFLVRFSLRLRPVSHLSKTNVDGTTQWRDIVVAHSCSRALESVSGLARMDDFFFESELANARPLNCNDTSGTLLRALQ